MRRHTTRAYVALMTLAMAVAAAGAPFKWGV